MDAKNLHVPEHRLRGGLLPNLDTLPPLDPKRAISGSLPRLPELRLDVTIPPHDRVSPHHPKYLGQYSSLTPQPLPSVSYHFSSLFYDAHKLGRLKSPEPYWPQDSEGYHICEKCRSRFNSSIGRDEHQKTCQYVSPLPELMCRFPNCTSLHHESRYLREHERAYHRHEELLPSASSTGPKSHNYEDSDGYYDCKKCRSRFNTPTRRREHQKDCQRSSPMPELLCRFPPCTRLYHHVRYLLGHETAAHGPGKAAFPSTEPALIID